MEEWALKKGNLVALCSIAYVGIIRNYIAILKSTILSTDISFRCLATTLSDSGIACIVLYRLGTLHL